MGDLITQLSSLVSLRKTANISVPGLLIALSVLCVLNAFPAKPTEKPHTPPQAVVIDTSIADSLKASALVETCIDALKNPPPKGDEQASSLAAGHAVVAGPAKDATRATFVPCAVAIQSRLIAVQAEQASLSAEIATEQKIVTDFNTRYSALALALDPLAGRVAGERDRALAILNGWNKASKEDDATITMLTSALTMLTPAKESASKDPAADASKAAAPPDVIQTLINRTLNLLILSVLFGLVVDPIMAALQPPTYEWLSSLSWFKHTTFRMPKVALAVSYFQIAPTERGHEESVHVGAPEAKNLTDFSYQLNYALGLGLVSDTDLDGFRQRYLYPSQLILNVIVSMAFFLPALGMYCGGYYYQERLYYVRHDPWWIALFVVLYLIVVCWMLMRSLGQYHSYRNGLQALIAGRKQKQQDAGRKAAAATPKPKITDEEKKLASGLDAVNARMQRMEDWMHFQPGKPKAD